MTRTKRGHISDQTCPKQRWRKRKLSQKQRNRVNIRNTLTSTQAFRTSGVFECPPNRLFKQYYSLFYPLSACLRVYYIANQALQVPSSVPLTRGDLRHLGKASRGVSFLSQLSRDAEGRPVSTEQSWRSAKLGQQCSTHEGRLMGGRIRNNIVRRVGLEDIQRYINFGVPGLISTQLMY